MLCPRLALSVGSVPTLCPRLALSVGSVPTLCPRLALSVGSVPKLCPRLALSVGSVPTHQEDFLHLYRIYQILLSLGNKSPFLILFGE